MFSWENIQNEVLTITSEHTSSEYHFDRKFQSKIYSSDQTFENYKEEFIKFKGKYHDELIKSSSGTIKNGLLTSTSEHSYSEDHFKRKSQVNISPSDKNSEQPE